MNRTIYTIGYSGFPLNAFIQELKKHSISVVVDVRSSAYSERYPDYNKPSLQQALKQVGIYYRNYTLEFGARQEDRSFYSPEGYLDFELFSKSNQFQSGVAKMINSTEKGYIIAFM